MLLHVIIIDWDHDRTSPPIGPYEVLEDALADVNAIRRQLRSRRDHDASVRVQTIRSPAEAWRWAALRSFE